MVFVLDNYDSFTYNLVQYLGELGVRGRRTPATIKSRSQEIDALHPNRIVISPGPCTPQEAGISIEVIRHFAGRFRCWVFASDIRPSAQLSAEKSFARPT